MHILLMNSRTSEKMDYSSPSVPRANISLNDTGPTKFTNAFMQDEGKRVIFVVMCTLQIVTGSLFNSLVLFVFFRNRYLLQTPSNHILLNLAITDFLACCFIVPGHMHTILTGYITSAYDIVLILFVTGSMGGAVLMTVDRFLAIFHPLRYVCLVTTSRTRLALASNWSLASLLAGTFFIHLRYRILACVEYVLAAVNLAYLLTILFLYAAIFRCSWRQIQKVFAQQSDKRKARVGKCKTTLKSAKRTGCVVFFFVISYLPVFVIGTIRLDRSTERPIIQGFVWALSCAFWNSCVNPLIYCVFSEKLRATMHGTLRGLIRGVIT